MCDMALNNDHEYCSAQLASYIEEKIRQQFAVKSNLIGRRRNINYVIIIRVL